MEQFLTTETLVIELLLIVSIVAAVVRRLRVPYTVALVVAGLLLTFRQTAKIELTPELILALFVPPLVFEAAFHVEYRLLRENLVPLIALAVPGVVITTLVVGLLVSAGVRLPPATGLVFGALISATDPVAVVALFRALGAPRRLAVLVEGESLLNDGTAIVVFNLAVGAAMSAAAGGGGRFEFVPAAVDFVRVSAIGVGVGVGLGLVAARLIARIDDYLIETTLTTVLAFGSYLVAERLHASGVLAVVAAGIVCGNFGPRGMSPTTRIVLHNFWEYLAFVANSLVFLLIGLEVNIPQVVGYLGPIAVGVAAVLASRAIVVYGLGALVSRHSHTVPRAYRHVLFWGGLRGAIGLALVLSLPATFPDREVLRVMTFGVVLFTLLGQGTTMGLVMRRLGLVRHDEAALEQERRRGRLMALNAARERLEQRFRGGMISKSTWEQVEPELGEEIRRSHEAQLELLNATPRLRAEELADARREGLRARRAELVSLFGEGVISEQVYAELTAEVDSALASDEAAGTDRPRPSVELGEDD
jgi:CPA1 family monovalent cation:H+ antiporter